MPQVSVVTSSTEAGSHALPSPFLSTRQTGYDGTAWVHVAGELDLATSRQLGQTLREAQLNAHRVVLDLRDFSFIDSFGVRVILTASREARREGGRLMLVRGPSQVDRMLTLSGACTRALIFDLDPTEPAMALLDVA